MAKLSHIAVVFAVLAAPMPAMAQTPEPEALPFKDAAELTEALTRPGRCPKNYRESYQPPCAVVKYVATDEPLDVIYRPIFRVVPAGGGDVAAWTLSLGTGFRTQIKKVSIAEVFKDIRTSAAGDDKSKKRYMPVDVFG